jgi:hypothetical protein
MATVTRSITLSPGETFTLPPSSEIIFVSDSDNITTNCVDLPDSSSYKCGYFKYLQDAIADGGQPNYDTVVQFEVGATVLPVGLTVPSATAPDINTVVAQPALITVTNVTVTVVGTPPGEFNIVEIYFTVPEIFFSTTRVLIQDGLTTDVTIYVYGTEEPC